MARLLFTGNGEVRFLPGYHNQSLKVKSYRKTWLQLCFKQDMQSRVKRLFVLRCNTQTSLQQNTTAANLTHFRPCGVSFHQFTDTRKVRVQAFLKWKHEIKILATQAGTQGQYFKFKCDFYACQCSYNIADISDADGFSIQLKYTQLFFSKLDYQ